MKPVGIYSTTTATPPTLTPLASISSVTPSAGVYIDGYYHVLSAYIRGSSVLLTTLEKYDTNTWQRVEIL